MKAPFTRNNATSRLLPVLLETDTPPNPPRNGTTPPKDDVVLLPSIRLRSTTQPRRTKTFFAVYVGVLFLIVVRQLLTSTNGTIAWEKEWFFSSDGQGAWQKHSSNSPCSSSSNSVLSTDPSATVHVLYGLHGNRTGFLDQWEVNLKSTLLNAPLDHPLHVHMIVNTDAEYAIRHRLSKAGLVGSVDEANIKEDGGEGSSWVMEEPPATTTTITTTQRPYFRQPIRMTIYNVEQYHNEWTAFLLRKFRGKDLDGAYPMGVYYRLLAHKVILPYWEFQNTKNSQKEANGQVKVQSILYMDADVVVLSNLNDLWRHVVVPAQQEPEKLQYRHASLRTNATASNHENVEKWPIIYQWSATWPNSGFAVYQLEHMDRFWELLDELPQIGHTNDQSLLTAVAKAFPNITGTLPKEWDTHMGHGWRPAPHEILQTQERVGMAHFTGKPPRGESYMDTDEGVLKYCSRSKHCGTSDTARQAYMKTWGLVDYYVRIPWHYVRYFGESQIPIGQRGYPLTVEIVR